MRSQPWKANGLTLQAFQLRSSGRYALHPVEAALQYHRAPTEGSGEACDPSVGFQQAESIYRTGAQGLRLSEIPQLPRQLRELSRLSVVDRAGRKALRIWATDSAMTVDEAEFLRRWEHQGRPGGAEHQVYHDKDANRWFKRLYRCVNSSTLGDYLVRMRLHAVLFPESAYLLEGFTIHPKSKELAPVVSQPHIEVDITHPPVSNQETDDLMASMGFAPIRLIHDGRLDDGYFAYLHPVTGLLAHDLHDENVVRLPDTGELVVINPYISLALGRPSNSPKSVSQPRLMIHRPDQPPPRTDRLGFSGSAFPKRPRWNENSAAPEPPMPRRNTSSAPPWTARSPLPLSRRQPAGKPHPGSPSPSSASKPAPKPLFPAN